MAGIAWAYGICAKHGVDAKNMTPEEVIRKANELEKKGGGKAPSPDSKEREKLIQATRKFSDDPEKDLAGQGVRTPKVPKDVMKKVKALNGKPEGTYDLNTGKPVSFDSGYQVTFHQNAENGDPYGRYTEEEYDKLTNEMLKETGSPAVYGGVFGNPEVSFLCEDLGQALELMEKYHQHSIWDWKNDRVISNKTNYDKTKNPIGGKI